MNILLCSFNVLQSCTALHLLSEFNLLSAVSPGRTSWLYGVSIFAVVTERRPVIRRKHDGFPLDSAAFGVGTAVTRSDPCDIGFAHRAVMDPRMDPIVLYRTEAGVTASRVTLRSCGVLPKIQ